MHLSRFLRHIAVRRPGFVCVPPGGAPDTASPRRAVRVTHRINGPATRAALAELRAWTTDESCLALFERHDGMLLYCQGTGHPRARSLRGLGPTVPENAGIAIFPIADWDWNNASWREFMGDPIHEFERSGVAFGEVCHSGNYLVLHEGQVFYAEHDGRRATPLAESLSAFLEWGSGTPGRGAASPRLPCPIRRPRLDDRVDPGALPLGCRPHTVTHWAWMRSRVRDQLGSCAGRSPIAGLRGVGPQRGNLVPVPIHSATPRC